MILNLGTSVTFCSNIAVKNTKAPAVAFHCSCCISGQNIFNPTQIAGTGRNSAAFSGTLPLAHLLFQSTYVRCVQVPGPGQLKIRESVSMSHPSWIKLGVSNWPFFSPWNGHWAMEKKRCQVPGFFLPQRSISPVRHPRLIGAQAVVQHSAVRSVNRTCFWGLKKDVDPSVIHQKEMWSSSCKWNYILSLDTYTRKSPGIGRREQL